MRGSSLPRGVKSEKINEKLFLIHCCNNVIVFYVNVLRIDFKFFLARLTLVTGSHVISYKPKFIVKITHFET